MTCINWPLYCKVLLPNIGNTNSATNRILCMHYNITATADRTILLSVWWLSCWQLSMWAIWNAVDPSIIPKKTNCHSTTGYISQRTTTHDQTWCHWRVQWTNYMAKPIGIVKSRGKITNKLQKICICLELVNLIKACQHIISKWVENVLPSQFMCIQCNRLKAWILGN